MNMSSRTKPFRLFCWAICFPFSLLASGCGAASAVNCAIYGNNFIGHVVYSELVPLQAGTNVLAEYSSDNFLTLGILGVNGQSSSNNQQGMVVIPFSLCIPESTNLNVRAFVDTNGNGTWDIGEATGRDDGTQNGNSTYITRNLSTGQNKMVGVDLYLDATTAR